MRRAPLTPDSRMSGAERPTTIWSLLLLLFVVSVPLILSASTLNDTQARVRWVAVGAAGDSLRSTGMYAAERDGSRQWRWTAGEATLTLPLPEGSAGHRFRIVLHLTNPGQQARSLLLHCGPIEQSIPLSNTFGDIDTSIECPTQRDSVTLRFNVEPVRLPADGRALGVAVRSANVSALDDTTLWLWRVRIAVCLAALLTGAAAALLAVGRSRWVGVPLALVAGCIAVILAADSPWRIALAAPRPALLALAIGMLCHILPGGVSTWRQRLALGSLGALLPIIAVFVPDPALWQVSAVPWTTQDSDARALLPWLAVALAGAAVVLGGSRAHLLASTAALIAVLTPIGVPLAAQVVRRWSLTLALPDWPASVSVVGLGLLLALLIGLLAATFAAQRSPRPQVVQIIVLLAVALSVLIPWRVQTMRLNGDEPHYAVMAQSIADDGDLDPLDDYASDAYRQVVYSPDGNIAADRGDGVDRAAAVWAPTRDDRWLLLPPDNLVQPVEPWNEDGPLATSHTSVFVRTREGHLDALPPLAAGTDLAIAIPTLASCTPLTLLVAPIAPDADPPAVALMRVGSDGSTDALPELEWQGGVGRLDLATGDAGNDCRGVAMGVLLRADEPVVAEVVAHGRDLRVLPAVVARDTWTLGPLPRDPLGGEQATVYLALLNATDVAVDVTVRIHAGVADVATVQQVQLTPTSATRVEIPSDAGSAISVVASEPVAATAVGWLAAGAFVAPELQPLDTWQLDIDAHGEHLAGIEVAALSVGQSQPLEIDGALTEVCVGCAFATTIAEDSALKASDVEEPLLVGGVRVEERSAGLHYDLLLPLLAAAPTRVDFPWGALAVPVLCAVAIAAGVLRLLQQESALTAGYAGIPLAGAAAAVLLAPVSPFLVRLYTEPVAAALLIWGVVALAAAHVATDRYRWLALGAVAALCGILPVLHGRYLPLAGVLLLLASWEATREHRRLLLLALPIGAVALTLLALSPFTVALRERGSPSYLSTEWLPHNLTGMLLDRGSGLLLWAPWCLLALACLMSPRQPLSYIQRTALLLIATQMSVTMLRAGGWQTFSPPARYLLPIVPLIALFAVPGAVRLWRSRRVWQQTLVGVLTAASIATTVLLHWAPQAGYVLQPTYPLDALANALLPLRVLTVAPRIAPDTSSNLLGLALLLLLWAGVARLLRATPANNPRTNADS